MASEGKKHRKFGRNRERGQAKLYKNENRRDRNKAHKIIRTLKAQPNNETLRPALKRLNVHSVQTAAKRAGWKGDWKELVA